jgi:probable phosphoglycerate mutase
VSRLIIWRHGQTAWNLADRTQGQVDIELDDVGRGQAKAAASRLAEDRPDAIVSSDLRRAAETGEALGAVAGLEVRLDARLREQHFGEWQGLTNTEIEARYPEAWARWRRGEVLTELGIEDRANVARRATAAVLDAAALGDTVVVVTHGGTAMVAIAGLLGWRIDGPSPLIGLMNCHWAEIHWHRARGRWALRAYNVGEVPALHGLEKLSPDERKVASGRDSDEAGEGADSQLEAAAAGDHRAE